MSVLDTVEAFRRNNVPCRRQVTISQDGTEFAVTFQPENIVAMRHPDAAELREICHSLFWEVLADVVPCEDCTVQPHQDGVGS